MIKIGIYKPDSAFLPEVKAYYDYFNAQVGFSCEIINNYNDNCDYNVLICFYGFIPFSLKTKALFVSEYNSLSTGRFCFLKDVFKRLFNKKSRIPIALNEYVRDRLLMPKGTLLRPMGYFKELVKERGCIEYDVVYSGTLKRPGVIDCLKGMARHGFHVAVIGSDDDLGDNITSLGRLSLEEVYEIYSKSNYGLNFTPNCFPYNKQDSTKVIEYCAAGLKVITNRYEWVESFERKIGATFFYIDDGYSKEDISDFDFCTPLLKEYDWFNIIESSGLKFRIINLIENNQ
ncbi:glycosyltransferase family protein [Vibrio splendidus]|uniref:glycosyltransferase family protein n=1 Tax=Vibrio splendidus TaxID=29497 RepID=UPI00246823E7|nr:hypothetical protein [Vibrio splendidus]MDH6019774.1 hypothetical protein [Vibrio splendidus]